MEPTLEQQVQYLSSQIVELTTRVNVLTARIDTLTQSPKPRTTRTPSVPVAEATPRQIRYLHAVARELGIDAASLEERCREAYGYGLDELKRRDASTFIEQLQAERPLHGLAS